MRYKASLVISMWLIVFAELTQGKQQSGFYSWRSPNNGGINVLYCYLQVNRSTCKYSDLIREQAKEVGTGPCTAVTLVRIAAKHDLLLRPVSLTMDELSSCRLPVIVHMDGESPETGAFLLILAMSGKAIDYVNGPSATVHEMRREDFRRVWSGVALLPAVSRRQDVTLGMIGFGVGLVLLFVLRVAWVNSNLTKVTNPQGCWRVFKRHGALWFITLTILLVLMSCPGLVYCQTRVGVVTNRDLPPEVYTQLRKQVAAMVRVHLQYRETQAGIDVPNYYGGPTSYSVYFDSGHFYLKIEYLYSNQKGKRTVHEDAFDGHVFYYGDPDRHFGPPCIVTKYVPSDATDPERFTVIYGFEYLEAAGFYPPHTIADINVSPYIQSLVLHDVEESDSTSVKTEGGDLCITTQIPDSLVERARAINLEQERESLESLRNGPDWVSRQIETLKKMQGFPLKRTVTFVLDPKRGYGVVERTDFTGTGQEIVHVQCSEWKYYEPEGVWLPGKCVESYFTGRFEYTGFSDQPRLTVTYELNHADFETHSDVQFALNYPQPRSLIVDRTTPDAIKSPDHKVTYTVAADGTLLRGVALTVLPEVSPGRRLFWMCVYLIIAAIPPTLFFIHKMIKVRKG